MSDAVDKPRGSQGYVLPACPDHGVTPEEAADLERFPNCSVCEDGMADEIKRLRDWIEGLANDDETPDAGLVYKYRRMAAEALRE